jgi:hypothetical protein
MRPNRFLAALSALALAAALTASASAALSASIGQLTAHPGQFDGENVSVTGYLKIRGEVGWLQLCDEATTCIYLDNAEPLRAKVDQRVTLEGRFLAHATLRFTPVNNVLVVRDPSVTTP